MNDRVVEIDASTELGVYLSSRDVASSFRARVLGLGSVVTLDFSNVLSLSDSFADEFFAVIVEERGFDWFAQHLKVTGLSASARETILRSVSLRCQHVAS